MNPEAWLAVGPIGATLLFCLYLFRIFVNQSQKGRETDQATAATMVAEAHAERDRARAGEAEAEAALDRQRQECANELAELRNFYEKLIDQVKAEHDNVDRKRLDEWNRTRKFLYQRIAHLEKLLWNEVRTPPPTDL